MAQGAGASPEVFDAVIAEVGPRYRPSWGGAPPSSRFERDGPRITLVCGWSRTGGYVPVGIRLPFPKGHRVSGVIFERRSTRPGRRQSAIGGSVREAVRQALIVARVGAPIVVEGNTWGLMIAGGRPGRPIPPDTEGRLAGFTELVATAVANATSRAELAASRARVVAAGDATRRRIERDLHDGAQQQLVSLALALRAAQGRSGPARAAEGRSCRASPIG